MGVARLPARAPLALFCEADGWLAKRSISRRTISDRSYAAISELAYGACASMNLKAAV